jgi:hypothetical protein
MFLTTLNADIATNANSVPTAGLILMMKKRTLMMSKGLIAIIVIILIGQSFSKFGAPSLTAANLQARFPFGFSGL